MFDIIPFSPKTYNVARIADHLKCGCLDNILTRFIYLWSQAVHGNCFYDHPTNAWGATYGVTVYFDTEVSATSLMAKEA